MALGGEPSIALEPAEERQQETVVVRPVPVWLGWIDRIAILLVNLALTLEVGFVFVNTSVRALSNRSLVIGLDESSHLFLIMTAFLAGAVAYGRGLFMAITVLVEQLPRNVQEPVAALVQWTVIFVTSVIAVTSVGLLESSIGERTTMLGISYVWMTLPMIAGSLMFIAHAGVALARLDRYSIGIGVVPLIVCVAALAAVQGGAWVDTGWFPIFLTVVFIAQILIGVPVGFVLATVGILYVWLTGSVPYVAIASNVQRGSGGFIFLALPFFILAGFIMDRGGIGARIVDFLATLIGHLRGGMLQVSIVGMYIASGISGSKAADMAAIGIPMNKTLRDQGYEPAEAAAVLAASSAMGESIPPSIAILALGSVASVSTGALFLAGVLPAATIAVFLMVLVYWRARRSGMQPRQRASLRTRLRAGRSAIIPLAMPVLLVCGIVGGIGTPTEISSFAVVYGLIVGIVVYRVMSMRNVWQVLTEASLLGGMIFFTFSAATLFSWSLSMEGLPEFVASTLGSLGHAAFLPMMILITVLLGAVLESIVTIIILGPLLLPVAVEVGVHPLQYGIVMIEAFGIGAIMPPVGLALYISCAICEVGVERTSRPLVSYILVLFAGLLVVAFVPWITLAVPNAFNFAN
jgi:tripartite ATP-independent transporter DctM subunit